MAIVKKYNVSVTSMENPLEGIYVVTFKALEKKFKYKPGQFLHLALDEYNPSLPWPESRCFSMQSCAEDTELKLTFSIQGNYTGRMSKELTVGKELYLKLPYGDLFSKNHTKENCIFIAGGTGVTPYLSLFSSNDFSSYIKPRLHFGVRDGSYNIYASDFERAKSNNSQLVIDIVDQSSDGILNIEKIFSTHGKEATYFISGPPIMIKNFKTFLIDQGVADSNVRTDDWE